MLTRGRKRPTLTTLAEYRTGWAAAMGDTCSLLACLRVGLYCLPRRPRFPLQYNFLYFTFIIIYSPLEPK